MQPDDLLRRLLEVLGYAARGLEQLDAHAGHWDDEGDGFLRRRDKVSAEALLLAYLAARVPDRPPRLHRALQRLVDRAEAQIVTPRNEALLRRFPQTAATVGLGYILLTQLGRPQPGIEALLRRAIHRGFHTLTERGPFRIMDVRWAYSLLPGADAGSPDALLPLSTLAASPHPIYAMDDDAYALTHAVFYLTDFGLRSAPGLVELKAHRLIDPFVAWNAVRPDLDLLGELLMTATVLPRPLSPHVGYGMDVFFRAWDRSQGLTGPGFSGEERGRRTGADAEAYEFGENYHTRFVGGMLCALGLLRPWVVDAAGAPPLDGPPPELTSAWAAMVRQLPCASNGGEDAPEPPGAGDRLEWIAARLIATTGASADPLPLWLRSAEQSDLPRGQVERVLYDAMLTAAARSYLLVQLAEALAAGATAPELRSPTFYRALAFLIDQQLADGTVGIHSLLSPLPAAERNLAQVLIARFARRVADRLSPLPAGPG